MNPATAVQSMPRPMVNDIAGPAPMRPVVQPALQAQPISAPAPAAPMAPAQTMTTNLVTNIPVHDPRSSANPASEDAELDKIMRDVGHELKKDDQKVKKARHSIFSRKAKPTPPVAIQPSVAAPPAAPARAAPVHAAQPAASTHPVKPLAAVKSKSGPAAPVMVIMVTVLVTGLLMAAAVYTYK